MGYWNRTYGSLLLIAAAIVAAYAGSLSGAFVFDDLPAIVENPTVLDPLRAGFSWRAASRPFTTATFAFTCAVAGMAPPAFHIGNIAVHLIAAWLLFDLSRRVLEQSYEASTAQLLALAGTLMWAVHPLQTQAVTYIVQRAECLAAMFYLLSLWCLWQGAHVERHRRLWDVAAVAACYFGVASKQTAVTLPLTAVLFDRVFLTHSWRESIRQRGWVYLVMLPAAIWAVADVGLPTMDFAGMAEDVEAVSPAEDGARAGFDTPGLTPWTYARSQPVVLAHYVRLVFWPYPLCFDYAWPVADTIGEILPFVVFLAIWIGAGLYLASRGRASGFCLLAPLFVLMPTSSVMPIQDLAVEHRMYLPSAGIILGLVAAAYAFAHRRSPKTSEPRLRSVFTAGIAMVVFVLTWMTINRNRDYADPARLWESVVRVAPENPRGQLYAGYYASFNGQHDRALKHLRIAIKLYTEGAHRDLFTDGDRAAAWNTYGTALMHADERDAASAAWRNAIRFDPELAAAYSNLGAIALEEQRLDDAVARFTEAVALKPSVANYRINLGKALLQENEYAKAAEHLRVAVALKPKSVTARHNFGAALQLLGNAEEAVEQYRAAVTIDSKRPKVWTDLAGVLHGEDRLHEELACLEQGLADNPKSLELRLMYAGRLLQAGNSAEARRHYELLLDMLDPQSDTAGQIRRLLASQTP